MKAHNPGRTPNRIIAVTARRDGEQVPEYLHILQHAETEIEPFGVANLDYQIVVFESIDDPERAYGGMSKMEIEVKALRGGRRMTFEPRAFRALPKV